MPLSRTLARKLGFLEKLKIAVRLKKAKKKRIEEATKGKGSQRQQSVMKTDINAIVKAINGKHEG